jgi:hypothetical protein
MKIALDGRLIIERPLNPQSIQLRQWLHWLVSHPTSLQLSVFTREGGLDVREFLDLARTGTPSEVWPSLWFEQWEFPRMARRAGMDLMLYPRSNVPLISPIPYAYFGGMRTYRPPYRFAERIAHALGVAGRTGAAAVLWPNDRADQTQASNTQLYMPFVPQVFTPDRSPVDKEIRKIYTLPDDYALIHSDENLDPVLAAWTWVVSGIGEYYSLLILSTSGELDPPSLSRAEEFGISETLKVIHRCDPEHVAGIYRQAKVLISPGGNDSGKTLRWALASGVPIAGFRTLQNEGILGEAGYLVEPDQTRSLGAAVLSLLVQDELADELREKGLQKASAYQTEGAMNSLGEILLQFGEMGVAPDPKSTR